MLAFLFLLMTHLSFANLPEGVVYITGEEKLLQEMEKIKPGKNKWFLFFPPHSFEMYIIQRMAKMDRWKKLSQYHTLTLEQVRELIKQHGLTIEQGMPYGFPVKLKYLKSWLEQDLAPKLRVAPNEFYLFVDDFLQIIEEDLQRQADLYDIQPDDSAFMVMKEYLMQVKRPAELNPDF